jgi:hypothetical protein
MHGDHQSRQSHSDEGHGRSGRLAVEAMRISIQWNGEKAEQVASLLADKAALWDTPFEVARWEALRDELLRCTGDAVLHGRLAFFYSNVRLNAERVRLLFDFVFGPLSDNDEAPKLRSAISDQLLTSLPELASEAHELDQALATLEGPGPSAPA